MDISERANIDLVIRTCDGAFENPVTRRRTYQELLEKIHQKGKFVCAYNGEPIGYCAFYANDSIRRKAYISLLAISPRYQGLHVGVQMLNTVFEIMRTFDMEHCLLEVKKYNQKAIHFYEKNQFIRVEERAECYLMERPIDL